MPSSRLSAEEIGNCINFGVALVMADVAMDYETCHNEPVTSSLFELMGADKSKEPSVISRIDESSLDELLYSWGVPLPVPVCVPAGETDLTNVRRATLVERGGAKLAWDYCRQVVGNSTQGTAAVATAPQQDTSTLGQLTAHQQLIDAQAQAMLMMQQAQHLMQ